MGKVILCALIGILVFSTISCHRYVNDLGEFKTFMTDWAEETELEIEAPDIRIVRYIVEMKHLLTAFNRSERINGSEKITSSLSREVLIPPPKG